MAQENTMMLWLVALACTSGSIEIGEDPYPRGGGSDTELLSSDTEESTAPTDTDTETDPPTETETETETEESETDPVDLFEGEYQGSFSITVPEWGDWEYCGDELILEVDDRLRLEATGDCRTDRRDDVELELSGEVDEDGNIGGSYVLTVEDRREDDVYEGEFKGRIVDDVLEAGFEFELDYERNEVDADVVVSGRRR